MSGRCPINDQSHIALRLRSIARGDIEAGLRLCRLSSWNQVGDDWRFFFESPDGGGHVAEKHGVVVGTVAFLRYQPSFSWLAMMLVDPSERRAGIGSYLMRAALDALANETCIRLDATPFGEPLYRGYGFIPEYELVRAVATVRRVHAPESVCIRSMAPPDFAEVFACDRGIFGADRSALLASFHQRAPELAFVARNGADVLGYCFGRPGYLYHQLGPIVARSADIAQNLVSRCLSMQEGKRVAPDGRAAVGFLRVAAIDVPAFAVEWIRWLEGAGFRIERRFVRMRRGENLSPGLPDRQFAIAGPEFG